MSWKAILLFLIILLLAPLFVIVPVVIVMIIITVTIVIIIVTIAGERVGIRLCWHSVCSGCTCNGPCNILAGDILADVLCSQSADYLPVAMPMHVVIQRVLLLYRFTVLLQIALPFCYEVKQKCINDSCVLCMLFFISQEFDKAGLGSVKCPTEEIF